MNAKFISILGSGLAGFIFGGLLPIFLVVLLKFNVSSICSPGKSLARAMNLTSSFTIYTPTETGIGIYSVIFTILIYAIVFSVIFVGFNFIFGSRVQSP